MRPMIKGVADEGGHNGRVRAEFLVIGRVSGDVFLVDAGAADGSPFVMVTAEPQLCQIRVLLVLRDVLRRHMAVVIDDRQDLGIGVVENLCRLCCQKKVFTHECFHCVHPFVWWFGAPRADCTKHGDTYAWYHNTTKSAACQEYLREKSHAAGHTYVKM